MFYLRISWLLIWTLLAHCTGEPRPETENEKRDRLYEEGVEANFLGFRETKACEGCNLSGTKWPGADLRGARLKDATLIHGDYRGADFRGADLTNADLGANLAGADLRKAKVEGGRWKVSRFRMVPLRALALINLTCVQLGRRMERIGAERSCEALICAGFGFMDQVAP